MCNLKLLLKQLPIKNNYINPSVDLFGARYLWNHVLEGFHDFRALSFLEIGEAAGDDDDSRQHNSQIQLDRVEGEQKDVHFIINAEENGTTFV